MAGETGKTTSRLLNRMQHDIANVAATGTTLATGDLILTADISDDYKVVAATPGNIVAGFGVTATAAAINAAAGGTMAPVLVTDVAAYTVLAADSGKMHIIPELTASCTFTLPTGAAGLYFPFMSNGIATEAQNWVFTAPTGVFYRGGVQFVDTDEPASPALITSVHPNGSSHITLTVNVPSPAGTFLMFVWDGTRYVINGTVYAATVPAFS